MPSRKLTRSLSRALSNRLIPSSEYAAASGGGGFDWTQFFGVSDDGFVYDGSLSRFYTDSAMTTLATASGTDPVGAIEDLSGKGNHAKQTTSGFKPVFYTDGEVKSAHIGSIGGQARWMSIGNGSFYSSAAHTILAAFEFTAEGGNGTNLLTNYNGVWSGGTYFIFRAYSGAADYIASSGASGPSVSFTVTTKGIVVASKGGTGAGQASLAALTLAGVTSGSTTGTNNGTSQGPLIIGANGVGFGTAKLATIAHINRKLTAEEEAAAIAHLVSTHGGWTP